MRDRIPRFLFILLLVLIAIHIYMSVAKPSTGITQPLNLWEIFIPVGLIYTFVLLVTFLYQSIIYGKDEEKGREK